MILLLIHSTRLARDDCLHPSTMVTSLSFKHDDYCRGDDADDNLSSRFESGSAIESGNESDYVFPFRFFVKWFAALGIYNL